ncbi:MAG: hypothetical protein FWC91_08495 [Defluviitaleaceae bacterium]|nr:hypothetical protein [Defluviitaleaceae bacterium]
MSEVAHEDKDRYHDHMKATGFHSFERGERGSTSEHLSVLDFKAKIRQEELAEKENKLKLAGMELEDVQTELNRTRTKNSQLVNKQEAKKDELKKEIENLKKQKSKLEQEVSAKYKTLEGIEKMPIKAGHSLSKQADGTREIVTISKSDWEKVKATAIRGTRNILLRLKYHTSSDKLDNSFTKDGDSHAIKNNQARKRHNSKIRQRSIPKCHPRILRHKDSPN